MQQAIDVQSQKGGNGGRVFSPRPQGEREQNDRLVVHVGSIPPTMPEEIVKQTATQFGTVRDFQKVNRNYEKAYQYAPAFGFLTFEDEASANRALQAGFMLVGETRLILNPRRHRLDHRGPVQPRFNGGMQGRNAPRGNSGASERPQEINQVKKSNPVPAAEIKIPVTAPNKPTKNTSSTCTVYGLPEAFGVPDLMNRAVQYGRVINAHIFEFKDREGQRFGTINFDSSLNAEEFHRRENGNLWDSCAIKVTFEPFNVARKNNSSPSFRPGHSHHHSFQRYEPKSADFGKKYSNRGPRHQAPNNGRFHQRPGFGPHVNQNNGHQQVMPQGPPVYQQEQHFYEPQQVMGYQHQQYPPPYPAAMGPPQMNDMGPNHMLPQHIQYGPGIQSPPPMVYGQPMGQPMMQVPYPSPPPQMMGIAPMNVVQQYRGPQHVNYPPQTDMSRAPNIFEYPGNNFGPNAGLIERLQTPGEISLASARADAGTPQMKETAKPSHPLVIKPEHYLQAGYAYGNQMPENLRPAECTTMYPQGMMSTQVNLVQVPETIIPKEAVEEALDPKLFPSTVPDPKKPEDPTNLYIKNLDDNVIDKPEHLEAICKQFGEVVSVAIPTYENGIIKGFGFVKFATAEQALEAMTTLQHKFYGKKRLFVSYAESGGVRSGRLVEFHDGKKSSSPSDPLIEAANARLALEKEKAKQEGQKVDAKDGDATVDSPAKAGESEKLKKEISSGPLVAKLVVLTKEATKSKSPENEEKDSKEKTAEINGTSNGISDENDVKQKRKLSAEELKELDPAIQFIGERPSSDSTANALLSSREPSPPTSHTDDQVATSEKTEKLRKLLKGLQNSDLKSFPELAENGVLKGNLGKQNKKDSKVAEVQDKVTPPEDKENPVVSVLENQAVPDEHQQNGDSSLEVDRPDTRNSTGSESSRVSQEEFIEVLKGKYGNSIPSEIRATDVLEAVDDYVKSRNNSQRASPNIQNEQPSEYKPKEPENQSEPQDRGRIASNEISEMANIVAPTPSRKVSIQKISTPDESHGATSTDPVKMDTQITQNDPATSPNSSHDVHGVQASKENDTFEANTNYVETTKQNSQVEPLQNKHATAPDSPKPRGDTGHSYNNRRSSIQQILPVQNHNGGGYEYPVMGNQPGPNESSYQYSQNMQAMHPSQQIRSHRPNEQVIPNTPFRGHPDDRFHPHQAMPFGNAPGPQTTAHHPSLVCEGPCCQYGRYPPTPHTDMGNGFPPQIPVPNFGTDIFGPPIPPMFNGHPGMPPYHQWSAPPYGYPNGPAYPQHPQQAMGPQGNFPQAGNQVASLRDFGFDNNGSNNRGYPNYYQHAMPQHGFGGLGHHDPGMMNANGGGNQAFSPQQQQYRPQGGPVIPTF